PEGYIALDDTQNVFKKILVEGTGPKPTRPGSEVKVDYTGVLFENGEKFDSSVDRGEKFRFKIGKSQVIKGWDVGVASMQVGEKAELLIQPEYGYGKHGSPPSIPPNAVLLFTVELFELDESTADLSVQERIEKAEPLKAQGNEYFKKGDYPKAIEAYTQACQYLWNTEGANEKEKTQMDQLNISLWSNTSQSCLKLKDGGRAKEFALKVLKVDPTHSKACYRLVLALVALGDFEEASKTLEEKKDYLKDVDLSKEKQRIQLAQQQALQKEKQMFAKMFQ
ncbi:hypothetical protein EDD86DRAFT_7427, partial [Gorgonomyces haynaldii]